MDNLQPGGRGICGLVPQLQPGGISCSACTGDLSQVEEVRGAGGRGGAKNAALSQHDQQPPSS